MESTEFNADERAALLAVAEAATELEVMLDALASVLPSGVPPQVSGRFKCALAQLAAVRREKKRGQMKTTISPQAAAVQPLPPRLNDTEADLAELCNEQASEITRLQCERQEARNQRDRLRAACLAALSRPLDPNCWPVIERQLKSALAESEAKS